MADAAEEATSTACRSPCATPPPASPRTAAIPASGDHAGALERRAVPHLFAAPRPAREGVQRLDHARRARGRNDNRAIAAEIIRACATRARACSAIRPTPISSSPTRWRRRRRTSRPARARGLPAEGGGREATATNCRSWRDEAEGGNFAIARMTGAITPEKARRRCTIIDDANAPLFRAREHHRAAFDVAHKNCSA